MKTKFYLLALGIALSLSSCSNEDLLGTSTSGDEATVTITAQIPSTITSRAFSDGSTAKNLTVLVFQVDGENKTYVKSLTATFKENELTTSVTTRLMKQLSYQIVFWAESPDSPYELAKEGESYTGQVKMNYKADGTIANDEERDAFFGSVDIEKVSGDESLSVDLYRPFAQLNIGTLQSDIDAAKENNNEYIYAEVSAPAYTQLNLLDGTVSEETPTTIIFSKAKFSEIKDDFPVAAKVVNDKEDPYKYLSMNYLLVGKDKSELLEKVSLKVSTESNATQTFEYSNVPVQRNYQTNIYGNLFSNEYNISVTIKPDYIESKDVEVVAITKSNAETALNEAIAAGATATLTEDVTIDQIVPPTTGTTATINLNGHTLYLNNSIGKVTGDLIITGGEIVTANSVRSRTEQATSIKSKIVFPSEFKSGSSAITVLSSLTVENVEIEVPRGYAIYAADGSNEVIVKNSVIKSYYGAVGTNASTAYNVKIDLENSEFYGSCGVFLNVPLNTTIKKCKFYGWHAGAMLRGGSYNISESEFYLDLKTRAENLADESIKSADKAVWEGDWTSKSWGSGQSIPASPLVIGNRYDGTSYDYATTLNGTLSDSKVGFILEDGQTTADFYDVYVWANQTDNIGVYFNFEEDNMLKASGIGKGIFYGSDNIFFNNIQHDITN